MDKWADAHSRVRSKNQAIAKCKSPQAAKVLKKELFRYRRRKLDANGYEVKRETP